MSKKIVLLFSLVLLFGVIGYAEPIFTEAGTGTTVAYTTGAESPNGSVGGIVLKIIFGAVGVFVLSGIIVGIATGGSEVNTEEKNTLIIAAASTSNAAAASSMISGGL